MTLSDACSMLHLVLQLQVHLLFTLSKFILKSYFV